MIKWLFLLLFSTSNLYAGINIDDFTLGFGSLTEFPGKVQSDDSGDESKFDFNPLFVISTRIPLSDNFDLLPEFGFTIPGDNKDPHTKKWTSFFITDFGYKINRVTLRLGTGLFFTRISGNGGTESLANGNTFADFALPATSVLATNLIFNAGPQWRFHEFWSARGEVFVFNVSKKENRAIAYVLTLQYHWGPDMGDGWSLF
jgi:hypothetical protein